MQDAFLFPWLPEDIPDNTHLKHVFSERKGLSFEMAFS